MTAREVSGIRPLEHAEAMTLAGAEYERFVAAVEALTPDDWTRPTDNDEWDVKAMVAHVLGMMDMIATVRECVRQQRAAGAAAKRSGRPYIDELTAIQVGKYVDRPVDELRTAIRDGAARALAGRRRAARFVRALPVPSGSPEFPEKWTVGYMVEVILTRDTWMHRVDLSRATGGGPSPTPDHDGRIVADAVAEWARRHGQPFTLLLTGPAGGSFTQGGGGEPTELDAVEFCRILSGRGPATGLLSQRVPF